MAGLKLKAKKCQLFQEEIPFLGHVVPAAGIGVDRAKCQQVRDWPVPRDLHEVRSFVGLCLYYRRQIQGFTEPHCTSWTPEEMAARQDADPDIGPIMRWKRAGNDRPRWEDISPESREAKVLWRLWERLYLVGGVLHRRFHELEGQGWRP